MKNEFKEFFKTKLLAEMARVGIKKREMAARLQMKYSTFASYLEERSEPSLARFKEMCDILGTTMDKFMEESPKKMEVVQTN